jgi:DNA-nicking Smr family endonuclease
VSRRPRAAAPAVPPPAALPERGPADDAEELFAREMAGVRRLSGAARARVTPQPPAPALRAVTDPDAEALAELSDLVTGDGPFDIASSVEFVEGAVAGLDRRVVRRLRAGDFAFQSHLDLHGMTAGEARIAVDGFLTRAHQNGQRCVLIVHGRGLNSKDQVPVLKHRLTTWLSRGSWSRLVLAFTSARPCDGGAGALYVLLRRQRDAKRPIHVTQGAKW